MMKLNQKQVQHLFLRAGFGESFAIVDQSIGLSPGDILESEMYSSLTHAIIGDIKQSSGTDMSGDSRKNNQIFIRSLNAAWMAEMATTPASINEKMAFFWHNHFACKPRLPGHAEEYIRILRMHALDNFGDLLRAVSKSAAMLVYLNNIQNKASAPNENFAREVMELFTLGRDNGYTEKDIREAARAFTGWSVNVNGEFMVRHRLHDNGIKSVLGNTGNLTGDDVIDILLQNKQTARYLSHKWVRYFVNHQGDPKLEQRVADELFHSNYDIKRALYVLFTSASFYEQRHIGSRIKSPVELITGIQRQLGVQIKNTNSLIYLQRSLGQTLLDPPNVSGWPDGKAWVDSASLNFRLKLPEIIFRASLIENIPEAFDDEEMMQVGRLRRLEADIDLSVINQALKKNKLSEYLLQVPVKSSNQALAPVDQVLFYTTKPEYQLC